MIDIHMSDLFFNHQHPHLDEFIIGLDREGIEVNYHDPELRGALMEDAEEFADTVLGVTGQRPEPAELVEDFLKRL